MLLSTDPAALTLDRPHTLDTDDVLRRLESTADGLGTDETQRRLNLMGPNRLPDPRKANPVVRFLRHFNDVLIYVLLGAAAVTALLGYWIDTAVILGVVVINGFNRFNVAFHHPPVAFTLDKETVAAD
mgnify:CR=1 FL=1